MARVLLWGQAAPQQQFQVVTEVNPLVPVEQTAVTYSCPTAAALSPCSCSPSTAPGAGDARGKKGVFILGAAMHFCFSELPAFGSLQVTKRALKSDELEKRTGVSVSGLFKTEGNIQMLFLL